MLGYKELYTCTNHASPYISLILPKQRRSTLVDLPRAHSLDHTIELQLILTARILIPPHPRKLSKPPGEGCIPPFFPSPSSSPPHRLSGASADPLLPVTFAFLPQSGRCTPWHLRPDASRVLAYCLKSRESYAAPTRSGAFCRFPQLSTSVPTHEWVEINPR